MLGVAYLCAGMASTQGSYIIALLIILTGVSLFFGIKWSVIQAYTKIKGKVASTEFKQVSKRTKAIKEMYKVFKDKYCPIIK